MNLIFRSFKQAFAALFHLKIVVFMLLPPLLSVFGFTVAILLFGQQWFLDISSFFAGIEWVHWFEVWSGWASLANWLAVLLLFLALVPLFYLGSVLLTSILVMPLLIRWVLARDFPHLIAKHKGSFWGSLLHAFFAVAVFLFFFSITLPLWVIPGMQVLIPLLLTAQLNKKIFLYDVLHDYATAEEREQIESEESGPLYAMGLLLGSASYLPLAFLFLPIFSALCYIYFGLHALGDRRSGRF